MTKNEQEEIDLEVWADEIIKTRDLYDNNYVFEKDDFAKEEKRSRSRFFSAVRQLDKIYIRKKTPNPRLSADLITYISRYLIDMAQYQDNREELIETLRFYRLSKNIFRDMHGTHFDAYQTGERIGIFIYGLKLFGSSALQGKKSVAKWTNNSLTKVESHYTNCDEKGFYSANEIKNISSFIWANQNQMGSLILEFKDDPFPKGSPPERKTYDAYLKLKEMIIKSFEDPDYEAMLPHSPLQIRIDWEAQEKIRQKIIALK